MAETTAIHITWLKQQRFTSRGWQKNRTENNNKMQTLAYGVDSAEGKFHQMEITRRNVGENDVHLQVIYSGICHSDIHQVKNEWSSSKYPMVPGHEILGRVVAVGGKVFFVLYLIVKVSKFKKGDLGGIGCMVDSCRECHNCKSHEEQFCTEGSAFTYNGFEMDKKTPTYGGYSTDVLFFNP